MTCRGVLHTPKPTQIIQQYYKIDNNTSKPFIIYIVIFGYRYMGYRYFNTFITLSFIIMLNIYGRMQYAPTVEHLQY